MKIHLPWIRATAAAVLVAGVGVHPAAAQYAPYRPIPQQPAASAATAPAAAVSATAAPQQAQAPATQQNPYSTTAYTAYRTQPAAPSALPSYPTTPTPAYATPQPTPAYASPTGAQYAQPTAAYPQYPQTAVQYPQTPIQQYPTTYGAYPYVAQQPTPETIPAPKNTSATQPSNNSSLAAPAGGMPANGTNMSAAQPGGCGCNAATYGAGDYYTTPGCGCGPTGGYPNCGISNYMGETGCSDTQWFGGIYFLEMGRTNASPVKLTAQVDHNTAPDPYYPQPPATVMTNRDVNFDFREGLEVRIGSTFTIGEQCNACQSSCGYNTGCGCNSCAMPTTYAWEVAWWGINSNDNTDTVVFDSAVPTTRIYGMKSFVGLEYDPTSSGTYRPVNDYYGYQLPITAPTGPPPVDGYVRVLAQRVRTDFKAQNLELNVIRFPMCNTGCSTSSCGCNTGCGAGYDASGCSSNYTGCNGGCDDSCGLGFSMYGSCGVRYFHVDDEFMYANEFGVYSTGSGSYDQTDYNGFTGDNGNELYYDVKVKNDLVGPQVGWTNDYCWGKWNLFCNSTFGIFDNHMTSTQRMWSGGGAPVRFAGDGSTFNVNTHKDAVAFLGELRAGTAYDFSCHWRGVIAYRAVALTGLATASDQLQNDYTNRASVGLINSDNSVIIHGAEVGVECRY